MESINESQFHPFEQSHARAESLLEQAEKRVRHVELAATPGNSSPTIAKLATALVKAQGEFLPVQKSQTNKYRGTKYADLSDVIDATRPALVKYGLAFVQRSTTTTAPDLLRGSVKVRSLLLHESGEWLADECELPVLPMPKGKNTEFVDEDDKVNAQAFGAAITYARRYSASELLGVAAESDGAAVEERPAESAKQQKAKPPRAPGPTFVTFGPRKGADVTKLSNAEIDESLDLGRAQVAKAKGDESWVPKLRTAIGQLESEKARRFSQLVKAPETETQAQAEG